MSEHLTQVDYYMLAEELVKGFPMDRLNDPELLTENPQLITRLTLAQLYATLASAYPVVPQAAETARANRQAIQDAARADIFEQLRAQ